MTNQFGQLKNIANIDDLILVAGYGSTVFQVEGYTHEVEYNRDSICENIIYDITDVKTLQYELAFQEDVSVICRAEKADEYLSNMRTAEQAISYDEQKEEIIVTQTDKYNRKRVDDLLWEWADYKELITLVGDEDGEYAKKVDSIESTINFITEGKR